MIHSPVFTWIILPLLIIIARIVDVSIGTVRIIIVGRGYKYIAPILGFFEVLIWLIAVSQILSNYAGPITYIAYAAGFAAGNYIGIIIEEKLSMGLFIMRIISGQGTDKLCKELSERDFGITRVQAEGARGPVELIYVIIRRKDMPEIREIISHVSPGIFYSIEDVRATSEGIFPAGQKRISRDFFRKKMNRIKLRKGK